MSRATAVHCSTATALHAAGSVSCFNCPGGVCRLCGQTLRGKITGVVFWVGAVCCSAVLGWSHVLQLRDEHSAGQEPTGAAAWQEKHISSLISG